MKDLYKLLSGIVRIKINGLIVVVEPFSCYNKYIASILADEEYQKAFESGHFTEQEILDRMTDQGFWGEDKEKELVDIPKNIEQMKVDYYGNYYSLSTRQEIHKHIGFQRRKWERLVGLRNGFLNSTCEYIRNQFNLCYLLEKSAKIDGECINFNQFSVFSLANKYSEQLLDEDEIREVAKSDGWRTLWISGKTPKDVFGKAIIELTDQQVALINWSRIYDNVYESTETPSEDIIHDDYALDGWFIVQRKKRDQERKQKETEVKLGKNSNAGEVFLPFKTGEDLKAIYDMNDLEGKVRISSIQKDLARRGSLNEGELTSTKQQLQMQANRAASQALKGRK